MLGLFLCTVTIVLPCQALSTPRCTHDRLEDAFSSVEECIEDTPWSTKVCQDFKSLQDCTIAGLSSCFQDHEVEAIEWRDNLSWRKVVELMLDEDDETRSKELDSCMYLATKQEAEKDAKYKKDRSFFPWLKYVRTDKNCSEDIRGKVQDEVMECLDRETIRNLESLRNFKIRSINKSSYCAVFESTFGVCLRLPWTGRDCFSPREANFLRKTFVKIYRDSLEVAEEISSGYLDFSLSDCVNSSGVDWSQGSMVTLVVTALLLVF